MGKSKSKASKKGCADGLFDEKKKGKVLGNEGLDNGVRRKKSKIMNSVEERVEMKDFFPQLPEHIIHHIISFLRSPKDAARISILSRKWKSIWDSFPIFEFDQRFFEPYMRGSGMENFVKVVDKSLATRLEAVSSMQKFKLHLSAFNGLLASRMNCWIQAALKRNVKELEIHVHEKRRRYRLPQAVLSGKAITSLKLYGMRLDNSTSINLSNLRVLSIKNANVDVNIIQNFFNSCPLIEDLRLVYCNGLNCLQVSGLAKLNRVEVHECHNLERVEIDAPNLQTFWFYGKRDVQCKINLAGCGDLKTLTLKDGGITDELFQDQMSNFPNLENLVLIECNKLERITILSDKIKRLSLLRCRKLEEANIDARHLISFEYTGDKMPFSSMNISGLREVKLQFPPLKENSSCLRKFRSFVGKINKSRGFNLFVCSKQVFSIYEELSGFQLLPSRNYKLEFTKSSKILKDLADSCLLKNRPKVLNVVSFPRSEFLQYMRELLLSRAKNPECCRYYANKCWRHYLEDVKVSESNTTCYQTTFGLNWKPSDLLVGSTEIPLNLEA